MRFVTIIDDGGQRSAGCVIGEEILDLSAARAVCGIGPDRSVSVVDVITHGSATADATRQLHDTVLSDTALQDRLRAAGCLGPASSVQLDAPLPSPTTLFAHGQAYRSHLADWSDNPQDHKPKNPPAGFLKSPTSIVGPGAAIRIPRVAPDRIDFEGELCVVFGRECHGVSRDEAMDYVAGYTIINDVSAREWTRFIGDPANAGNPAFSALNMMYKNFPTFCPLGPWVITTDEVPDHRALRLVTRLNGEVMQDASVADLIWDIPELIETYSTVLRFGPGDIMSTGTPGGVGAGRKPPVFMKAGDVVSVSVEGVGELVNSVIGPD